MRRRSGLRRFEKGPVRALLELLRRRADQTRRTGGESGLRKAGVARRHGESARGGAAGLETCEGGERIGLIRSAPTVLAVTGRTSHLRPGHCAVLRQSLADTPPKTDHAGEAERYEP